MQTNDKKDYRKEMKVTAAAQKLAIELINAHDERRYREKNIILTRPQARKLLKGVPENRTPWGISDTEKGKVRWYVFSTYDGHKLFYEPAGKEADKWERMLQKHKDKALEYLTETKGRMKLEAWSVTQEHKEATLKCWKSLKNRVQPTSKQPKIREESPETTTTYILTAYRFTQIHTPIEEDAAREEGKVYVRYEGDVCMYELKEEVVGEFTTNDLLQAEDIRKKAMEDWKTAHQVTALSVHVQEEGQPEQVQHFQYKRSEELKPRYSHQPDWGMRQSKARKWQPVESIDTSRETLYYALTGKDC